MKQKLLGRNVREEGSVAVTFTTRFGILHDKPKFAAGLRKFKQRTLYYNIAMSFLGPAWIVLRTLEAFALKVFATTQFRHT